MINDKIAATDVTRSTERPQIADEIPERLEELRRQIPKASALHETALLAEFHELRPQMARPPDERGITPERWRLWQARKQCDEFLRQPSPHAPIHERSAN